MGRRRRFLSDDGGAAAVEFALVVLPLLLFLLGTIEFARLMWTRQSMQSVAMTAARCVGILQSNCTSGTTYSETNTRNYVIARAAKFGVSIPANKITVVEKTAGCGTLTNGFASVRIQYTFNSLAPALISALSGGKELDVRACFPVQS